MYKRMRAIRLRCLGAKGARRATAAKTSLENKQLCQRDYCDYSFLLAFRSVDEARFNWTGRTPEASVNYLILDQTRLKLFSDFTRHSLITNTNCSNYQLFIFR